MLGFYFPLKEIIPDGVQGEYFFRPNTGSRGGKRIRGGEVKLEEHARAVVEGQIMSVRVRLEDTLGGSAAASDNAHSNDQHHGLGALHRVILTGGSSHNVAIQQIVADVLNLPVYVTKNSGSAASGGALLAKYAWWKTQTQTLEEERSADGGNTGKGTFEDMRKEYGELELECVAKPDEGRKAVYDELVEVFRSCEEEVVKEYKEGIKFVQP